MFTRSRKKKARPPDETPSRQATADRTVPAQRDAPQQAPAEAIPPVSHLEGGPDSPLEIPPAGWKNTFKRAIKKFSLDRCTMAAGSLAYHWFFALFPALVAAIGVISLVHLGSSQLNHLISGLGKALPGGAASVFQTAITQAQHRTSGALTTVILGIVLARITVVKIGRAHV